MSASQPRPAGAHRMKELCRNARYFVEPLGDDRRSRERYEAWTGLCLPQFALVWAVGGACEGDRSLLLDVQRATACRLLADLGEHIRNQGAEAKDEPPGPERDRWERALHLTPGWPPQLDVLRHPERNCAERSSMGAA